ncbi:hypothetical protein BLOT_015608 [Blomia tropicalis]|nr:hypothetical protein BLOT_015608 [Blomia tropicalis]
MIASCQECLFPLIIDCVNCNGLHACIVKEADNGKSCETNNSNIGISTPNNMAVQSIDMRNGIHFD